MPEQISKNPQRFSQIELPALRLQYQEDLKRVAPGHAFCVAVTCDAEMLYQFTQRCRAARCRPPNTLAYLARCLGKTLEGRTELLASQQGRTLYIPSRVDALVAVEVKTFDGAPFVRGLRFEDLSNRTLEEIAAEMKTRLRDAKRTPMTNAISTSRFAPKSAPLWWRFFVQQLRDRGKESQKRRTQQLACVQLSSTAQWMNGQTAWGMRTYRPPAPSVMLVGQSRRPVAVGDEIAIHFCLDLTFTFDHKLVDGAPATRFIADFCREVESGAALEEFPIRSRSQRQSPAAQTR